jgi:serine/threonine protein kinase/tetratricopeptide (TPR) repeat protein
MGQETRTYEAQSSDWRGTDRYEVLRCIGMGGMGTVYEALDRQRQQLVALKTLRHFGPSALYRFKQEFRTLADVSHPNLVRLYELVVSETGQAFFTMELVRGSHFLEYVRRPAVRPAYITDTTTVVSQRRSGREGHDAPSGGEAMDGQATPPTPSPADFERLRDALRQLVEGIDALHAAGKVHRDVKPSNVLVTAEGRVVVLDFGVAIELRARAEPAESGDELVGTARYMAPEQSTGEPQTPASDLYSAGVMLYEALVGRTPFAGSFVDIITMKCRMAPPPPSACAAGVPVDLDALCVALLDRDPERRPSSSEVLRRLGVSRSASAPRAADLGSTFVGREPELRALRDAFESVRSGRQVTVRLVGAPGMGKSRVAHHFLDELARSGQAVVLRGRAYERESIPYKAVDSAVDALSRHLIRLDESGAPISLPDDIRALARVFPVLQHVPRVGRPADEASDDPKGVRTRGFVAMRHLLSSLGERRPVVFFIDDAQWGDVDSVALLRELTRPPNAPPFLLAMTYREKEAATSAFLSEMSVAWPASADVRHVEVGPLTADKADEMALSLLPPADEAARRTARTVVRESSGSPLLIEELARSLRGAAADGPDAPANASLDQMVADRFGRLPAGARRLAELVAVAGRPLAVSTFAEASGSCDDTDDWVALLRSQRFVRTGYRDGREVIETIHDRIRETIVAKLGDDVLREHHGRLATVLDATPAADLEALAFHMLGAGETRRGTRCAERAAEEAASKLAFIQAARLFRLTLENLERIHDAEAEAQRVRVRLAQVLERGGRASEAADAYSRAAERAAALDRVELETSAAEQLVFCGRIDEGAVALRRVLAEMGIRAPRTALGAVVLLLLYGLWLRVVGLRFRERAPEEISREDRVRVSALRAVSQGLGSCDVILGACMQARHMLLAMRVGDRFQMLLAIMGQVVQFAIAGKPEGRRERAMLAVARDLASRCEPDDASYFEGACGLALYMRGRYREALDLFDGIEALARGSNRPGTAFARQYAVYACFYLGRLREEAQRTARLMRDIEDRGDVYTSVCLRTTVLVDICLVADDPDAARLQLREAMAQWGQNGFHLQHWFAMLSEAGIELYLGDGARAYERVQRDARALKRSFLLHSQSVRGFTAYLRGCCAIASIDAGTAASSRRARIDEARRMGQRLEKERSPWGPPLAAIVLASAANATGERADAIDWLRRAVRRAEAAEMALHAWAARHQLGALLGGAEGKALLAQAEQSMATEGVRSPARMARLLVPGRWSPVLQP